MINSNQINTISDARIYAENRLRVAVGHLAHAFNACDEQAISYRYGASEQARLKDLIIELIELVNNGEIELLQIEHARKDLAFQSFLSKL